MAGIVGLLAGIVIPVLIAAAWHTWRVRAERLNDVAMLLLAACEYTETALTVSYADIARSAHADAVSVLSEACAILNGDE